MADKFGYGDELRLIENDHGQPTVTSATYVKPYGENSGKHIVRVANVGQIVVDEDVMYTRFPVNAEPENQVVRAGTRFNHARVLDTQKFDGKTPQRYEVTKIAGGKIWFAPIYAEGIEGSERLGKSDKCDLDYFYKVAQL